MIKTTFLFLYYLFFFDKDLNARINSVFRILPWHLDLNMHLNNAKYLSFCNQARLIFLAKSGLMNFLLRNTYRPVIYKNVIEYKKSLKLFQKFSVITHIQTINDENVVLEHKFIDHDNNIYAICLTYAKVLSKQRKKVSEILKEFK